MGKYDDYVEMCENEGETPDLYADWHAKRMAAGREQKAAAPPVEEVKAHAKADSAQAELEAKIAEMEAKIAALQPEEEVVTIEVPLEWGEDGVYRYYSEFKEHSLVMKSERAIGADGRLVSSAHVAIKFDENHYQTTDKEISDWLENEAEDKSIGRKEFGWHIFRTTVTTKKNVTAVTDGPKTSIPQQTHRYADRPTPLHANV